MNINRRMIATLAGTATLFALASSAQKASIPSPAPQNVDAKVAVLGKVAQPGTFLFQPANVSDAILAAGGISKDGDACKVTIRRGYLIDPANSTKVCYNYDRARRMQAPDMTLLPGDVIDVPKKCGGKNLLSSLNDAAKRLGGMLGSAAKPLLASVSPALGALAAVKSGPMSTIGINGPAALPLAQFRTESQTSTALAAALGQALADESKAPAQSSNAFLAALLRAIAAEPAEVQARIFQQVQALLSAAKK